MEREKRKGAVPPRPRRLEPDSIHWHIDPIAGSFVLTRERLAFQARIDRVINQYLMVDLQNIAPRKWSVGLYRGGPEAPYVQVAAGMELGQENIEEALDAALGRANYYRSQRNRLLTPLYHAANGLTGDDTPGTVSIIRHSVVIYPSYRAFECRLRLNREMGEADHTYLFMTASPSGVSPGVNPGLAPTRWSVTVNETHRPGNAAVPADQEPVLVTLERFSVEELVRQALLLTKGYPLSNCWLGNNYASEILPMQ